MRKFILNSVLFLSLFFLCNVIVFLFAQNIYHKDYNKVPDKSFNTFIFADSYGLPLGSYGEEFDVYNFAAASESYYDIKRKITYLIRNDYQINKIYIGVDNHCLSTNRERMNNLDRSVYFSNAEDFNNPFAYFKNRYLVYYASVFRPSVRALIRSYLFQNAKALFKKDTKTESNALAWSDYSKEKRKKEAEDIVAIQFESEKRSTSLEEALMAIIALSEMHGFELIGVKFPVTEAYSKALNKANFEADELFASHGLHVLNYKRRYLGISELFADPNHLNDNGGQEFIKTILK